MLFDCIALGDFQLTPSVMHEVHYHDELGFLNLIERLIACNNLFYEMLLKLLLVPWPLCNNMNEV